jgi:hypothetical protein
MFTNVKFKNYFHPNLDSASSWHFGVSLQGKPLQETYAGE